MKQVITTIVKIVVPITLIMASASALANPPQSVQIIGSSTCDDFGGLGDFGCRIEPLRWVQPYPTSVLKRINIQDDSATITVKTLGTQSIELIDSDTSPEIVTVAIDVINNGSEIAWVDMTVTLLGSNGQAVRDPIPLYKSPMFPGINYVAFGGEVELPMSAPVSYESVRLDIYSEGGPVTFSDLIQVNIFEIDLVSFVGGNPNF